MLQHGWSLRKERKWKWSRSVVSDSLQPPWTVAYRLLHPWDFPGKSTGVDCHFLLQGIFPTQGLNPTLPHCRQILYCLRHQGSQIFENIMLSYESQRQKPHDVWFLMYRISGIGKFMQTERLLGSRGRREWVFAKRVWNFLLG